MKKNLKLKERLGAFFLALLFVLQAVLEPFAGGFRQCGACGSEFNWNLER